MKNAFRINFDNIKGFIFYAVYFVFIAALSIRFNAPDNDIWSRLIMGKHVVQTHSVLYNDIISFSNTHTWFDPEWLSSAFLYLVQSNFGMHGLTFLKVFSLFLMFFLLVEAIKRLSFEDKFNYNIFVFLIFVFLFLDCGFFHYLRCQFITFCLFIIWIYLLEKIRLGQNKYLYFLPLIILFWLNTHGGVIAPMGTLFVYILGEFLNRKPIKKYFIVFLFCALAFLINPWGFDYIKFLFHSSFLDRSWILEWQSPFASEFIILNKFYSSRAFYVFSFLVYLIKLIHEKTTFKSLDKTRFIFFLLVSYLGASHIKHLALFFIVSYLYLYDYYCLFFKKIYEKCCQILRISFQYSKSFLIIKDFLLYFVLFGYSMLVLLVYPIKASHNELYFRNFPVYPVEFLKINNIKGKIFSVFSISGYIAYKGYPDLKIYMDGRQEQVYDLKTFDEGMFFLNWSGDNPQIIIDKYSPDIFLLEKTWKALKYFKDNPNYKLIYIDDEFLIYVKNKLAKFTYKFPEKNDEYYLKQIFNTNINFKKGT